jgi:putative protease
LVVSVVGAVDQPLTIELLQPSIAGLSVQSVMPLQVASQRPLDHQRLTEQLGRLGGTSWRLERLELHLEGDLFLPVAELNRMRRQLLDALETSAAAEEAPTDDPAATVDRALNVQDVLIPMLSSLTGSSTPSTPADPQAPGLVVLVRSLQQLKALKALPAALAPIRSVVADLEHPRDVREAVAMGRGQWPEGIWLSGSRVTRPNERWTLEPLIRARPDGFLIRNADQLETLSPLAPCIGDFSLNVANPLAMSWYRDHWGLKRVTASYDLNLKQLLDLTSHVDGSALEVTLHQHMPLFHMEHCLFCAFLSEGHDHTDCGRPCEEHTVTLRDRSGVEHPLRADLGCRNTLFNGTAQTGVEALPALQKAGVTSFRLELLNEDAESTLRRVRLYADALAGRIASKDVWRQERIHDQLGVTRGSLLVKGPEKTSRVSR